MADIIVIKSLLKADTALSIHQLSVQRFHLGAGMDHQPPLAVLRRLGYNGSDRIALLPPILLDPISPELLLSCDPEGGNDLLAYYTQGGRGSTEEAEIAETPVGSMLGGEHPQGGSILSWPRADPGVQADDRATGSRIGGRKMPAACLGLQTSYPIRSPGLILSSTPWLPVPCRCEAPQEPDWPPPASTPAPPGEWGSRQPGPGTPARRLG